MSCHDLLLNQLTEILKMNSYLMHAAGERFTEHDARLAIEAELLECRRAVLALWRHLTHANFVADNLNRLLALQNAPGRRKSFVKSRSLKSF